VNRSTGPRRRLEPVPDAPTSIPAGLLTPRPEPFSHLLDREALEPDATLHVVGPGVAGASPEPLTGWRFIVHNLIAHPLLVLCPPLGERLHDWTLP
jgi:hypothetical protein